MSEDPVKHPYQSPYVGFDNNPIFLIDPNGTSAGKYLSADTGEEIHDDGQADDKVYAVAAMSKEDRTHFNKLSSKDKTNFLQQNIATLDTRNNNLLEPSSLSVYDLTACEDLGYKDVINRAHWIYGEAGGELGSTGGDKIASLYAHTIKNLRNIGLNAYAPRPFESEAAMMRQTMQHGPKNIYNDFVNGTVRNNVNYPLFQTARNEGKAGLDNLDGARVAIRAVMASLLTNADPSNGSYQWAGGMGQGGRNPTVLGWEKTLDQKGNPKIFLMEVRGPKNYNHYFYKYNLQFGR